MILITGGTGTVGSEVVRLLAGAGVRDVRLMVREPNKAGPARDYGFEVVRGDFGQPETLGAALEGVGRAFLLSPPSQNLFEYERNFIAAAARAGVRHVVKLSAISAAPQAPEGFIKWHGLAEEELRSSGLSHTLLQGTFFMQNLLGSVSTIVGQGAIYQAVGEARAAYVDARDVAAVAFRALTGEGYEGKTYVITGPELLSYYDIADKLSAATGRNVNYVPLSAGDFRHALLSAGMPEWYADAIATLNELLVSGQAEVVTNVVEELTGKRPITFDEFARDYAEAFKGGAAR